MDGQQLCIFALLVGFTVPSAVSAQWLPDQFESHQPAIFTDTTSVALAQQASDVIVRNTVVGGILGAGVALGVWSLACNRNQDGGCESKWGLISAGAGAALGAITGIVATLAAADGQPENAAPAGR